MEQYISKSALVAEIKRRLWLLVPKMTFHQQRVELEKLLYFINTLEVKEVDLDKCYYDFLQKEWFGKNCNRTISEMMAFTAKHFFELGMAVNNKAQKGEE